MELHVVEPVDTRRVVALDVFVAVAAVAVLASLFFPWFTAEYEPHTVAAQACFDDSVVSSSGWCEQSWSGWRTISLHWALPVAAFVAFPVSLMRILGDHHRPVEREWLALSGALFAVVAFGFFLTPDLAALNAVQAEQAALYSAEPWVYTSVHYATGIFGALGLAVAAFTAAAMRARIDPAGHQPGRSHGALIVLALVLALFPISYVGELVTRF
ncbi:MAG: hypothetical protein HKO63_12760 [Acidimicrobiia bacterium]|nr:hypothetical protein [Acidimicrobiia bacterium]MBT8192262.1 hypothetical protein [Acidimicrobiia bacterium]NNL13933.1 hypothetical protein [Acidimicrobiia bacterium]NNL99065.1 hypothetical protein [Acidimicrobiia bacterium]RZV47253.1 MAG: hypothetical protein EX267_01625 [Acidimicrobiia bacterium]